MQKVELLAPAGTFEKLKYAYAYGADAAYAGIPFFSLRARDNEFSAEELREGYKLARSLNRKLYITANIFARNRKLDRFWSSLEEWVDLKPDAMIMSDPGLMLMVREKYPEIPIHLSVQANCMNWQAVKFWHKQGVERVILSRELTLEEIRSIKDNVPEVELESFVHGAICIAYSGRCLMSSYMSYRDANQGVCDNSCREKFNVFANPKETDYFIEDRRSPGEYYQIDEDEHGTYIMSAKDLNLIENLKEIINAGVCSLKVEGRTKSIYYLSMVIRSYRRALDDLYAGKNFDPGIADELNKVANRGYHKGFILGTPGAEGQNFKNSNNTAQANRRFAGVVRPSEAKYPGLLPIEVRGTIQKGDTCELITPAGIRNFKVEAIMHKDGHNVNQANPGIGIYHIPVDVSPQEYSLVNVCVE